MKRISFLLAVLWAAACGAQPMTPVTMQLNWHPQADFGGYFAAKAEGLYEKAGLDVTLKPGGPQLNIHQLLAAGQVDFVMGTSVRTVETHRANICEKLNLSGSNRLLQFALENRDALAGLQ